MPKKSADKTTEDFGEFCESSLAMILNICKNASRIDLAFDTYMKGSVKDRESQRCSESKAIEFGKIWGDDTLLPVEMETFWESISKKRQLQKLLFRWMTNITNVQSQGITFVLSGMVQELQIILCQSVQNGEVETLPELDNNIEEADMRLISHAIHAVLAGTERIVILSSDTDVLGIALYFWNLLNSHGLRQFWTPSDSTRYIRLHSLAK